MNVGPHTNPQIKASVRQEFLKRSNAFGDLCQGDVVNAVQGVRGCDDGVNTVLKGQPCHGQAFFGRTRSVIEAGQDVAMEVNQRSAS